MTTNNDSATDIPSHWHASRPRRLIWLFGLLALAALAMWLAFGMLRSMRQRALIMAVYPEGSLNAKLAKRYQEVLERNDIDLKLVPSAGAVESVARLRDPKSGISIPLVPGGITTKQDSPELVSLGTVFYQPLWTFSRGHLLQEHAQLKGRRISIGPEGSSSRALALELLGRAGLIDQKSTLLLALTPSESAQALIRGEIDAAIFVDGWESPTVQQLLRTNGVTLESLARADALVRITRI